MADESAITSLGYDASKAKQGADEFAAASKKVIDANAQVEAAEQRAAGVTETTATRRTRARSKAAADTSAFAAAEKAAADAIASVWSVSVDKQVEDLKKRDRFLAASARAYDPLAMAVRKAESDVSRLSGIIEEGGLADGKAAQATASLAGAKLKLAAAQQAVNAASAASMAASQTHINELVGVRPDFNTEARGEDIDAFGVALNETRSRFNPIFEAQQKYATQIEEISRALRTGAIDEAEYAAAVARTERALAAPGLARLRSLTETFDPATASAMRMTAELADLNAAQRLGINIAGGYTAAFDRIVEKYDEGALAAKRAAAAQAELVAGARSEQFATNAQRAFNEKLGVTRPAATERGAPTSDNSALKADAENQDRLNANLEKTLNFLDPVREATLKYNVAIRQEKELFVEGKLNVEQYYASLDKLTDAYNKQARSLSGLAEAERKATEARNATKADAQTAENAQLKLAESAQKYLDNLNPLLPVQRAYREELAKINELIATRNLAPDQGMAAATQAKKTFDAKSAEVTGVTTSTKAYESALRDLQNEIDPLSVAQRNWSEAVDFADHALRRGDLSLAQHDAAIIRAKSNLDVATEAIKQHSTATGRGVASAGQMRASLINLGQQAQDVAVSLQAGQRPLTVLLQQGSQIGTVFAATPGGAGGVLRAAGSAIADMITPTRVAVAGIAGLAAGFAVLVARSMSATSSIRQFDVMLRGMGANGLSGGVELEAAAKRLRDVGLAASDARDRIRDITRAGLNPAAAERIIRVQEDLKPVLGEQGGDQLKTALSGGLESTIKFGLSPALRAFNADQVDTWREMARVGQASRAFNQAFGAIEQSVKGANDAALSPIGRALRDLNVRWSGLLDKLGNTDPIRGMVSALNDLAGVLERIANTAGSEKTATVIGALTGAASGALVAGPPGALVGGAVGAVGGAYTAARGETIRQEEQTVRAYAPIPPATTTAPPATTAARSTNNGTISNTDMDRLVQSVIRVESGGNSRAVSSAGAAGLMQLMPGTAARYGVTDRFNSEQNVAGGTQYLRDLLAHYNGNVEYALMAYNWGEGNLDKALAGAKTIPSQVKNYASTVLDRAGGLSSSAAAGASAGTPSVTREKTDDEISAVTRVIRERDRQIEVLQRVGAASDVVRAKQEAATFAAEKELSPEQALRNEASAINDVYRAKAAEQGKVIQQTELETTGISRVAKGYTESVEAGLKEEAQVKATGEAYQAYGEIQSDVAKSFIAQRSQQLLAADAFSAIKSARESIATAQPEVARQSKLLDATINGTQAAHDQEVQNTASARAQDALSRAKSSGLSVTLDESKAIEAAALAQEKYKDAIQQGTRAAEAANDNRAIVKKVNFETSLVRSNVTPDEQTRQLALYDAQVRAAKDFANVDVDASARAARDAWLETEKAIADSKYQLTQVQREQEKWNNLVSDLASKIDSELTSSIENLFSEDKVESWGKRVNKWLGSFSSTLSSSLFIKPALGTVAGALGFGTAAQSLGSFGSTGSLFGGSGGGTTSGSSATLTKNEDGTFSLSNISSTASLGKSLGLWDTGSSSGGFFSNTSLGGLFNTSVADEAAGDFGGSTGLLNTSLGGFLGGAGAGFGAGSLLNSLLGGNKLTGTVGSGAGSLAGAAIGSIFPGVGTLIGGLVGGAAGGGLGGLFGQTHKSANATGVSIDLSTGKASGFTSSGSAENDRTLKEIRDDLTKFTKNVQSSTGGATSGSINPQATDQGIKLDYDIPGFGSGTYDTKDSQEAIDNAELAIVKGLTGVSDLTQMVIDKYSGNIDDLKTALDAASDYKDTKVTDTVSTVIDKTSDPSKLADALKFAETYDKIADAAGNAFASIPSDLDVTGPFEQARDDIKTTFDDIADSAKEFGLALQPVTDAREEANKRLTDDFDRYIDDLTTAVVDPLQSIVDIEKRAGDQRVKEAEAVAGDIEAVNKLNAKKLNDIWTDATANIKDLRDEFKFGDLSGLTATQKLPGARTKYVDTLAAVQGGDTSKWDALITDARSLFSLSKDAYGEGPKTAEWRTAITAVLDNVLASRSFAEGTKSTPPGMILVGERGPELMAPRAMQLTERAVAIGTEAAPPGTILVGEKGPELISQPGGLQVATHRETERILTSVAANRATPAPGSNVTQLTDRSLASGTTVSPPDVILVGDRRLESISQDISPQLHSSRDTERAISTLSPVSGAVSSANSNSSVVSNSSTSVTDRSSSISNQNVAAAFAKALPAQVITAGAADALNGMGLVGPHSSETMTLPQDRAVANGTTATPPGAISVAEKGSELISRPGGLEVHSNREVERIISALVPDSVAPSIASVPGSAAPSIASSNLSVISDSSTAASDNSSSLSVQNIAAALAKTGSARAFAGGTEATPPGMILVGETGQELISQTGKLQIYPHHETERTLPAMSPFGNPNTPLVSGGVKTTERLLHLSSSSADRAVVTERNASSSAETNRSSLIDCVPADRAFAGGTTSTPPGVIMVGEKGLELIGAPHDRAFAAGTTSTPPGMVLVGERGPELVSQPGGLHVFNNHDTKKLLTTMAVVSSDTVAMPAIRGFADGTTGQYSNLLPQPAFTSSFVRDRASLSNDNNDDVVNLLRDVVAAVNVNNNISRRGHYETGEELRTQTSEMRKPAPYEPSRRRA